MFLIIWDDNNKIESSFHYFFSQFFHSTTDPLAVKSNSSKRFYQEDLSKKSCMKWHLTILYYKSTSLFKQKHDCCSILKLSLLDSHFEQLVASKSTLSTPGSSFTETRSIVKYRLQGT